MGAPSNKAALPHGVQSDLAELRAIVGLLAFAVEARRVLEAVDVVAAGIPHVGDVLTQAIDFRRQWVEAPDTATDVLRVVYERLGALSDCED